MTEEENIYELIIKELSSEISQEEMRQLEEGLLKDSGLSRRYLLIKEYWNNFFPKNRPHSIIEKTEKKLGFTYHNNSKTKQKFVLMFVASVLLIISLGYSSYHILKPKEKLNLNEYGCGAGEIKEITLSDGTKVWINSMSLLIAVEPFTGKTREVKLFGEAYFEVAHNPDQPFIVKTQLLNTEVLGTNFDIIAYPTDEVHEIALHKGRVQLNTENNLNNKIILNTGDRAYFTTKTGKIKVVKTDLGKPAKWRDGILRFYDENLFSITKKLERKFHTRIFIADSIVGNFKYSAEFEEETLERILVLLSNAQEFNYTLANNGIIIKSKTQ